MDNYYLNVAVHMLEEFLERTTDPHYAGKFMCGRPMKPHGWQPVTNAEMVREMFDRISRTAPAAAALPR